MILTLLSLILGLSDPPEGFAPLLNGKDLSGWRVTDGANVRVWTVQDGILTVQGEGGGWLMTDKEYADFDLRLEFRLSRKGNSGVALRAPMHGDPAYAGMEIQIMDDATWKKEEKIRPSELTGSIYDVVPPSRDATRPFGEWNSMHIIARGRRIQVELNGQGTIDANLDDYKDRASTHPGLARTSGHLGLQSHTNRVDFRNI